MAVDSKQFKLTMATKRTSLDVNHSHTRDYNAKRFTKEPPNNVLMKKTYCLLATLAALSAPSNMMTATGRKLQWSDHNDRNCKSRTPSQV